MNTLALLGCLLLQDANALIEKLGDEDPNVREAATRELRKQGLKALDALRRAAESKDPEIRNRAEGLIDQIHPPMMRALDRHLERGGDEVAALDEIRHPGAPTLAIFLVWKRTSDQPAKILAFDRVNRQVREISKAEDLAKEAGAALEEMAKSRHASLSSYSNAVLRLTQADTGLTFLVRKDGRTLQARAVDGRILWESELLDAAAPVGVGRQVIRHLRLEGGALFVTAGKHSCCSVDPKTGKSQGWQSD